LAQPRPALEKGVFDGIFIADVIGYYDVYKGSLYHALQQSAQVPVNDPLQLAAPIALATEHLGIGITAATSFEHPYTFARRIATADHHTKGRLGRNIVTSYLESGAENVGDTGPRRHDNRYELDNKYLEVIYKLLEKSGEEDAVVRDRERRIFAHPEKVHEIGHKEIYFDVPGYELTEPFPQRTPVLYQAGASGPGRDFGARNAECVFVAAPTKATLKAAAHTRGLIGRARCGRSSSARANGCKRPIPARTFATLKRSSARRPRLAKRSWSLGPREATLSINHNSVGWRYIK